LRRNRLPVLLLAPVLVVVVSWISCSRHHQANVAMKPEDRLATADDLFAKGRCTEAIPHYERLLSEFPRPEIAELARFNLARCRMENEEYDLAVTGFQEFAESYPQSDLVDNAMFMTAMCYLKQAPQIQRDQTKTVEALDELNLLVRKYPASDVKAAAEEGIMEARGRLAEKEYLSGQLYFKVGDYKSAAVYFDYVVSDYADTPWGDQALLGKARTLERLGKTDEAIETYRRVVEGYPSGSPSREAGQRLKELGGGSETDTGAGAPE
jgi:outer membrane protein assembly factor BamD